MMTAIKLLLALLGMAGLVLSGLIFYRATTIFHEILACLVLLTSVTSLGLLGIMDALEPESE